MENDRKWELIASWLENTLSESEKAEFEILRAQHPQDVDFASTIWYNSGNVRNFQKPDLEVAMESMRAKLNFKPKAEPITITRNRLKVSWSRYVAAACLAGLISFGLFYAMQSSDYQKFTAQTEPLLLPDNSQIEVQEGFVTFRKGLNGTNREVKLKGQATFSVAKNASRPFVVMTQNTQTTVLGTKFTVSERQESTSIEVQEGKVEFAAQNQKIQLEAGESAKFDGRSINFTTANELIFRDEPLSKIALTLQTKMGLSIEFSSQAQKDTRLNINLNPSMDRRKIAALLSEVSGYVFEIKSDRWVCK
jgi:ferric-dicitrate binding protein FerR (iron transport regulator)